MYQQMNPMPTIPNYNQFANVYQPTNAYAQQNLTRVTGIEGARAYQMLANSTVALFDNNEDIMSLFKMTPYYYRTSKEGIERAAALGTLETRLEFVLGVYRKERGYNPAKKF